MNSSSPKQHFALARREAGTSGNYWDWPIARGSAEVLRLTGRATEAIDLARTGIDAILPRERATMLTELAAALLAAGDHESAVAHADQAQLIAAEHGHRLYQISALHVLADAYEAEGDRAAAGDARFRAAGLAKPVAAEVEPALRKLVIELRSAQQG